MTRSSGPSLSTPPRRALDPNGRTEEYRVYACTYNPILSAKTCIYDTFGLIYAITTIDGTNFKCSW